MRILKTANYEKISGKTERGKRDGTGPFEGSAQKSISDEGRRKEKEEECPFDDGKDKKKIKKERGKRDGTGPFEDSFQKKKHNKGKRRG